MKYAGLIIVVALPTLFGGTTSPPPPQSPHRTEATSTIFVKDPGRFPCRIAIVSIDDVSTEPHGAFGGFPPSTFAVSPGHHIFRVHYTMGTYVGFEKLGTNFEQPHSYTLCSDSKGTSFTAWFIDETSGKQIEQKQSTDWKRILLRKRGNE